MLFDKLLKRWTVQLPAEDAADVGVYFVSYPKCGATWTRLLLGKYAQLVTRAATLPLFDGAPYERNLAAAGIPRIKFTHDPLVWTKQTAADLTIDNTIAPFARSRVVLIARYPLDALISSHAQWKNQLNEAIPELPSFIEDPVHGLEKFLAFHNLWAANRQRVAGFKAVRYEDMRRATVAEMRDILRFAGLPLDETALTEAVEFASFGNMRKMQLSPDVPVYPTSGFKIFGRVDPSNPESFHVRRGVAGGYRDDLTPEQYRPLEARIARDMDPLFGYQEPPPRLSDGRASGN